VRQSWEGEWHSDVVDMGVACVKKAGKYRSITVRTRYITARVVLTSRWLDGRAGDGANEERWKSVGTGRSPASLVQQAG